MTTDSELRDMVVRVQTIMTDHVREDERFQQTVLQAINDRKSEIDLRHDQNQRGIAELGNKLEQKTEAIHSRISDVTRDINTKLESVQTNMAANMNSLKQDIGSAKTSVVGYVMSLVGGCLLIMLAIIGYLLTQGTPYSINQHKDAPAIAVPQPTVTTPHKR